MASGNLFSLPGVPYTSCPFSINVHDAFMAGGAQRGTVQAYSPVTYRTYEMRCDGFYPVVCTGGDRAVVYIY